MEFWINYFSIGFSFTEPVVIVYSFLALFVKDFNRYIVEQNLTGEARRKFLLFLDDFPKYGEMVQTQGSYAFYYAVSAILVYVWTHFTILLMLLGAVWLLWPIIGITMIPILGLYIHGRIKSRKNF